MAKSGVEVYDDRIAQRVNSHIEANEDKIPYLRGLADYISSSCSLNTTRTRMSFVTTFLEDCGYPESSELSLDNYTSFMYKAKQKNPGYANGAYYGLKNLSEYLYVTKRCPEDYMQHIKKPKTIDTPEAKEKRAKGFLTSSEAKRYLRILKDKAYMREDMCTNWMQVRNYLIVLLFLTTGIRNAALYKLDVDLIDHENKSMTIKEKGSKYITYHLCDEAYKVLKDYLPLRQEFLDDNGKQTNALFISRRTCDRLSPEEVSLLITHQAELVTNKKMSPHRLRASFCTNLYNETKDLYFVQKCMHHNNPATTERYIRTDKDDTKEGSSIMGNLFL